MALFYYEEVKRWEDAGRMGIIFPLEAMAIWESRFLGPLKLIEASILNDFNSSTEISVSDPVFIHSRVLLRFIQSIKTGEDVRIVEGTLYVPIILRELIGHHLGNDLHLISFVLGDTMDNNPPVLNTVCKRKIINAIEGMKDFNYRLLQTVRVQ